MNDNGKVSLLNAEEERELSRVIEAGREAAERLAKGEKGAALKAQVAADKGVPAELLSGTTEDELVASAERLLAFRGQQAAPEYGRRRTHLRPNPSS